MMNHLVPVEIAHFVLQFSCSKPNIFYKITKVCMAERGRSFDGIFLQIFSVIQISELKHD